MTSKKAYTNEELSELMNTTGALSEICEDSGSESDNDEIDELECDLLYDSDENQEYLPEPGDESSDEEEDDVMMSMKKKRGKRVASTPVKRPRRTSVDRSLSPIPTDVPTPIASTSATPAATDRGRRRQRDIPPIVTFKTTTIATPSKFRWSCRPQTPSNVRTPTRNIVSAFTPGPTPGAARNAVSPEEAFSLFFNDDLIQVIVTWTNKAIDTFASNYKRRSATFAPTVPLEVKALLGVLIISAQKCDEHIPTSEMWSVDTGCGLYRVAMSEARFRFLIRCLRFDDPQTRQVRREVDKFAAVREIWDIFIERCGKLYVPHENLTVDEQLLGFRGRCPFRMYIPNKPAKYGIKLVLINDSKSKYLVGGIPYLGKQGTQPKGGLTLGHQFTRELTRPYHGTHRNVTTDNWFTSVPLVSDLLNNCGMTLVGTVRANKKEIPKEMTDKATRERGSSAFLYTKEMTLVSYVSDTSKTTKKLVLLLSSQHTQPNIGTKGKPEIIEFYNSTKGGVDTFDQMCSGNSCSRKTRRWPLCTFYGMVNAANVNSYILYKENMERGGNRKVISRQKFMLQLGKALITPWATSRLDLPLPRSLQSLITTVCNVPSPGSAAGSPGTSFSASSGALVRCCECPVKSDRNTHHRCNKCVKPMCPLHLYPVCGDCI